MFVFKTNFTSSKSKRRYLEIKKNDAFLLEDDVSPVSICMASFLSRYRYSLNFRVPVRYTCLGLKKWTLNGNKRAFLRVSHVTVMSWFWGDVLFKGAHDLFRKSTEKGHMFVIHVILLMEQIRLTS